MDEPGARPLDREALRFKYLAERTRPGSSVSRRPTT